MIGQVETLYLLYHNIMSTRNKKSPVNIDSAHCLWKRTNIIYPISKLRPPIRIEDG